MKSLSFNDNIFSGHSQHHPEGSVIFIQRDRATKLYLILDGIVKLSIFTAQGDERIIEFIKPERFLGAPDIFSGSLYGITATAYTGAIVASFTDDQAKKLLSDNQEFASLLTRSLSQHSRSLGRQLIGDSFFPATARVAFGLLNLVVQIGTPLNSEGIKISITQNEIAKYVGCNRITVTNALAELAAKELVIKRQKHLLIPNPPSLRSWVDSISSI